MAWPVITEYTDDEKTAAKAEIDEAFNIVKARADYILKVSGKLTDEEDELRKIQTILSDRSAVLVVE